MVQALLADADGLDGAQLSDLARVKDLHGGLSSGQQALGRIVQALLADADGLDGAQLSDLARVVESYRDAVVAQENAAFTPSRGED
ncbi:hypothetical protein [Corynebacterium sp. MSK071]|uniref:hypothetical protein n=1 Tax=Corynebacterium sp. MSK071 TaxID=3377090 RepID=UPI00254A1A38|nr:hypothetical protein [Corynebacterium kefirresidentii]MDK8838500.1 hypothetical protein [Corynebacterium kefirresidentii]